jgi:hypothetical protein
MAISYNPRIVTDGLVLALDAGNPKSYPGSGTTWTDLSGNGNNGTLVNGVGYNSGNLGSLVFDGVDDRVTVSSSASLGNDKVNTAPIISLDFWANVTRKSGGGPQFQQLAGFRNGSTFGFFVLLLDGSGATVNTEARFWNSAGVAFDISVNYIPYFNKWTHIGFVANVNRTDLYINANLVGSRTDVSGSFGASSGNFGIGAIPNGVFPTLGNISSVKVYNKALTASEIQQNFNATRSRFGI